MSQPPDVANAFRQVYMLVEQMKATLEEANVAYNSARDDATKLQEQINDRLRVHDIPKTRLIILPNVARYASKPGMISRFLTLTLEVAKVKCDYTYDDMMILAELEKKIMKSIAQYVALGRFCDPCDDHPQIKADTRLVVLIGELKRLHNAKLLPVVERLQRNIEEFVQWMGNLEFSYNTWARMSLRQLQRRKSYSLDVSKFVKGTECKLFADFIYFEETNVFSWKLFFMAFDHYQKDPDKFYENLESSERGYLSHIEMALQQYAPLRQRCAETKVLHVLIHIGGFDTALVKKYERDGEVLTGRPDYIVLFFPYAEEFKYCDFLHELSHVFTEKLHERGSNNEHLHRAFLEGIAKATELVHADSGQDAIIKDSMFILGDDGWKVKGQNDVLVSKEEKESFAYDIGYVMVMTILVAGIKEKGFDTNIVLARVIGNQWEFTISAKRFIKAMKKNFHIRHSAEKLLEELQKKDARHFLKLYVEACNYLRVYSIVDLGSLRNCL